MRASEIRSLIQLKPVELDATRRRLSACHDVHDLRVAARRLIPRPVFDYVDGGSDEELSMAANIRAFRKWRLQPRAMAAISGVDTTARVLDRELPLPLVLAPTGYIRMMHPDGEIGAARSAQRHGLPYTLSTMSTTTIEAGIDWRLRMPSESSTRFSSNSTPSGRAGVVPVAMTMYSPLTVVRSPRDWSSTSRVCSSRNRP